MHGVNYNFRTAKVEKLLQKVDRQGKTDKSLGYGINVTAECDSSFLNALAAGKAPDYDEFFFDEEGALKPTFINSFSISRKLPEHKLEIEFDSVSASEKKMLFINVEIKNITVTPLFGKQFKVKFLAQISPNDDEILFINHAVLKESLHVRIIEPPQIGLDLEQDDN